MKQRASKLKETQDKNVTEGHFVSKFAKGQTDRRSVALRPLRIVLKVKVIGKVNYLALPFGPLLQSAIYMLHSVRNKNNHC